MNFFWWNLDRHWTLSTSPERYSCDVVFVQNLAIFEQSSLSHASCLKQPKNCLEWFERYANIISNISNSESKIFQNHFFIASMFPSVVDVLGRPRRTSSLTYSRSYLNLLCHNWTCVLHIVDSTNATVNFPPSLLISFSTQNLIKIFWSIFSNSEKSKSTPKHD